MQDLTIFTSYFSLKNLDIHTTIQDDDIFLYGTNHWFNVLLSSNMVFNFTIHFLINLKIFFATSFFTDDSNDKYTLKVPIQLFPISVVLYLCRSYSAE